VTSGMIRCFTSHGSKHCDGLAMLQQKIEREMLIPLTLRKSSVFFSLELGEGLRSVASRPGGENVQSDCK
jgi:hypothetical protein